LMIGGHGTLVGGEVAGLGARFTISGQRIFLLTLHSNNF
jgi:hypothetical protein